MLGPSLPPVCSDWFPSQYSILFGLLGGSGMPLAVGVNIANWKESEKDLLSMYLSSQQNNMVVKELKSGEERRNRRRSMSRQGHVLHWYQCLVNLIWPVTALVNRAAAVEWACCELLLEMFGMGSSGSVYTISSASVRHLSWPDLVTIRDSECTSTNFPTFMTCPGMTPVVRNHFSAECRAVLTKLWHSIYYSTSYFYSVVARERGSHFFCRPFAIINDLIKLKFPLIILLRTLPNKRPAEVL